MVWALRDSIGPLGFGVLLGLRMAASGWQTMFAPSPSDADAFARIEDRHPDRRLGLPPHPIIGFIHREARADAASRAPTDFYWSVIFVVVFFAIHVGRLDAEWTWLGMLSPAAATLGDIVAALVLSVVVLYPLSRLWHRVTRPAERAAWRRMLEDTSPEVHQRWSERGAALVGRASPAAAGGTRPREQHAARRGAADDPRRIADHRRPDRGAPDLGIQLVLQQRELGHRGVAEDCRDARRRVARRDDRRGGGRPRRRQCRRGRRVCGGAGWPRRRGRLLVSRDRRSGRRRSVAACVARPGAGRGAQGRGQVRGDRLGRGLSARRR